MKKNLILILVMLLLIAAVFTGCGSDEVADGEEVQEKVYIGLAVRSLTNPYYVQLIEGAEMFINSLPEGAAELQVLTSEGSDEKQINDIKALIAKGGQNTIIYLDPNNAPNAAVVAEICEEAGVYWSTTWSMAEGITPKDYQYYVFHQTVDDVNSGYQIANAIIENFETPGQGKILGVQGMLANSASINRTIGLENALEEYPDVELLDIQPADWNPQVALTLTETWLSTYDDIDGIWVANDSMALAVVEALKAAGREDILVAGIDGIPDAITAVQNGDMIATVSNNPWAQGGYALAIDYAAYKGELDTTTMTNEQMMFKTAGMLVSADTVEDYIAEYVDSKPDFDFSDIFATIVGPLE